MTQASKQSTADTDPGLPGGGRYPKGFRPHDRERVKAELKAFEETYPGRRTAEAIWTLLAIVLIAAGSYGTMLEAPWWLAGPGYLVSVILIARQQRILELFVHDASHGCWDRDSRRRNDMLANVFVAWPVLTTVDTYWEFHRWHHAWFGSEKDPCKLRMLGKTGLLTYIVGWYRETAAKDRTLLIKWMAWHLAVFIVPFELILGGGLGVGLWLAYWLFPMLTALPALRYVAEAEEHDYDRASTEFETTFNNLGILHRVVFHPAQDGYHVVHHMWPGIPMCRHAEVHRYALKHVSEYQQALTRTKVLEKL